MVKEWYRNGLGIVEAWYRNCLGMVWEWLRNGLGIATAVTGTAAATTIATTIPY